MCEVCSAGLSQPKGDRNAGRDFHGAVGGRGARDGAKGSNKQSSIRTLHPRSIRVQGQ
jgi:hypothetical protein